MWVPGVQRRTSGLAVNAFTYLASLVYYMVMCITTFQAALSFSYIQAVPEAPFPTLARGKVFSQLVASK